MKCTFCGEEIKAGETVCPFCGEKVEWPEGASADAASSETSAPPAPETPAGPVFACVKCGKVYPAGTKFCGECGGRVQEANAAESDAELEEKEIQLPGGVALELVKVEAGSFLMGRPEHEEQHRVTLTQDYWLGKYAVTQAQWEAVMGGNPSRFKNGGDYPVEYVDWNDARAFCQKLNKLKLAPSGFRFDLPTEAQWEYAARGGSRSQGFVYSGSMNLDEVAWYVDNSNGETNPVGKKEPNELGLFDMSGNVWEWCRDWYGPYQIQRIIHDPTGPKNKYERVIRGGSIGDEERSCRVANRERMKPTKHNPAVGFRVVLVRRQ